MSQLNLVIRHDYRLRFLGQWPLVGDRVTGSDGQPRVIIAKREEGNKLFLVTVPECMVSEERWTKIYNGEYQDECDRHRFESLWQSTK